MSRHRLTLGLALGALLTIGLWTPAAAHKPSDAYLDWSVSGPRVELRLDIALRDLDRELVLDADDDQSLTWGEVKARWPQIEQVARAGVQLLADGRPCEGRPVAGPPELAAHSDGRYAVLRMGWTCPTPGPLSVRYRLFADSDATHRGIARTGGPGGRDDAPQANARVQVLVPGEVPQRLGTDRAGVAGASPAADADVHAQEPDDFLGFVGEGLRHIAIGLDHILFLVTLLMVAVWRREAKGWVPRERAAAVWGEAIRLVTAFTVAHSITLALAAGGWWTPPARWVESLIAISVLVAAVDNLRPFVTSPRWLLVAVFGLVHGFGFAGPLQDLGLGGQALLLPLLGFNLGVELGQLLIVVLLLPVFIALRGMPAYRAWVVRGGSVAVAGLALVWTLERGLELRLLG